MVFSHDGTDSEGGSINICTDYDAIVTYAKKRRVLTRRLARTDGRGHLLCLQIRLLGLSMRANGSISHITHMSVIESSLVRSHCIANVDRSRR